MGREISQQHETRDKAYASDDHSGGFNLLRPPVRRPLSKGQTAQLSFRAVARNLSQCPVDYEHCLVLVLLGKGVYWEGIEHERRVQGHRCGSACAGAIRSVRELFAREVS